MHDHDVRHAFVAHEGCGSRSCASSVEYRIHVAAKSDDTPRLTVRISRNGPFC